MILTFVQTKIYESCVTVRSTFQTPYWNRKNKIKIAFCISEAFFPNYFRENEMTLRFLDCREKIRNQSIPYNNHWQKKQNRKASKKKREFIALWANWNWQSADMSKMCWIVFSSYSFYARCCCHKVNEFAGTQKRTTIRRTKNQWKSSFWTRNNGGRTSRFSTNFKFVTFCQ